VKFRDIEPPKYAEHMLKDEFIKFVTKMLNETKARYYDEDKKGRYSCKIQIDLLTQMLSDYDYEIIIKQTKKDSNENPR